ncbi:hypothetical protein EMPS_10893 [Entomortierella parvispora]|uniref:Uncharacterized protein n=1 Tax=Entomortierella parvispora TaxID=205924 RepID=A0A9P3M1M0_9FUNG|nr:hypothetical protein EMPS_10893 [Entomortierella parvispora]
MAAISEKHHQHTLAEEGNQASQGTGSGTTGRGRNRGGGSRGRSYGKARPATAEEQWIPVQSFELGTDDFILAPKIERADSEEALAAGKFLRWTSFRGFGGQSPWLRQFLYSLLHHLSANQTKDPNNSVMLRGLAGPNGLSRLTEILELPMDLDAGGSRNVMSFQHVALPLIGVLTRKIVCQAGQSKEMMLIYARVYERQARFLNEGVLRCMTQAIHRQSLSDNNRCDLYTNAGTAPSVRYAMLAVIRLLHQVVLHTPLVSFEMAETLREFDSLTKTCIQKAPATRETHGRLNAVLHEEMTRVIKVAIEAFDCKFHSENRRIEDFSAMTLTEIALKNAECSEPCGWNMLCGHVCRSKCHADDDQEHKNILCRQPCARLQPGCRHVCPKICGKDCGDCKKPVRERLRMPCGHLLSWELCFQKKDGCGYCQIKEY